MSESIFIFTFSPIQPFIAEARRAADLFTGSQILVELSRAVAKAIQKDGGKMIYPVNFAGDVPNKIVATIDTEKVDVIAKSSFDALMLEWFDISNSARLFLEKKNPKPDKAWKDIWDRQINSQWDVYWSSVTLGEHGFTGESMTLANQALESTKRTRAFENKSGDLETGFKDTLSGKRSALRTSELDARDYWTELSQNFHSSKLKQAGSERLDALGSIKRFSTIAENQFPSTSTIASSDFLGRLVSTENGKKVLSEYSKAVENLGCFRVSSGPDWCFDGDLFYPNLLNEKRLKSDYHLSSISADDLRNAREILTKLIKIAGQPSPYYALIVIDGDSMGEWVSECNTIEESQSISKRLDKFASTIKNSADLENKYFAQLIYNGGDDVMLMAPLSTAVSIAKKLADDFEKQTEGRSASAGIVICHHQSQLSFALKLAREAESAAKKIPGKSGVCVKVFKRSGAPYTAVSHWNDLGANLDKFIDMFKNDILSSRFAYDVQDEGRTAAFLEQDAQKALLKRLVNRHKQEGQIDISNVVDTLSTWSVGLNWETKEPGLIKLGNWLVLARFIAQGGIEK